MKNAEQNGAEHEQEVAAPEAHPVGLPRLAQPVSSSCEPPEQQTSSRIEHVFGAGVLRNAALSESVRILLLFKQTERTVGNLIAHQKYWFQPQ